MRSYAGSQAYTTVILLGSQLKALLGLHNPPLNMELPINLMALQANYRE
jgi:hypothetical protein